MFSQINASPQKDPKLEKDPRTWKRPFTRTRPYTRKRPYPRISPNYRIRQIFQQFFCRKNRARSSVHTYIIIYFAMSLQEELDLPTGLRIFIAKLCQQICKFAHFTYKFMWIRRSRHDNRTHDQKETGPMIIVYW